MLTRPLVAAGAALSLLAPLAARAQTPPAQPAPPAAAAPAAPAAAAGPALPSPNLTAAGDMMATLKGNPHFSVLVKALDAVNLSQILAATPQLTLFAPTDEAFAALPPGAADALMKPANLPTLQKILTYHLVHLDLDQSKVKGAKGPVTSVEGQPLQVDGFGPTPMVDSAHILQDGVQATNGWIYPVDKVMIPSDVTLPH
ncbi:MAG: fasciclin domain-containing protein [Caulobacteraceae bacterium]|nr:fasciclin domain-containing protein [Caulobacteraceae bacterium]